MTKNPISINKEMLAEQALATMNHKKITSFETMHYRMYANKNNNMMSLINNRSFNSELINAIIRITITLKAFSYQQQEWFVVVIVVMCFWIEW